MKKYIVLLSMAVFTLAACKTSKNTFRLKTKGRSFVDIKTKSSDVPATSIKGKVNELESDQAVFPAYIILMDESGRSISTHTDEKGNFSIFDVPTGNYHLKIKADDYEKFETIFYIKKHADFELDIKLARFIIKIEKPVIYFYPTQKQNISVKINYKGKLTHTYPSYENDGWSMTAAPDGSLWDKKGLEYYALFWEGIPDKPILPDAGFVVEGKKTAAFLEEKLALLGLNRREANEFIMYWLPRMESNPYNFIHFSGEAYEQQAALIIDPKPETMIRVMMITQPLNSKINFPTQDLNKLRKLRKGYTVVEWGGTVVDFIK